MKIGMTIKKDRLPILWGHDQAKILGFFDKKNVAVNGGVNIEGSLVVIVQPCFEESGHFFKKVLAFEVFIC